MTNVGRWVSAFLLVALLLAPSWVRAQDAAPTGDAGRGARLAYTCLGCHGIPNYKNTYPSYRVPKLHGQSPAYIVIALQAYRNQERGHATMYAHAAGMSDQDMADVAAYLAGTPLQAKPDARPVGTAPEAAAICVSCHGNDGIGITPEYPVLAGQHADYLQRALLDYKRGGRKNAVMAGFVGALSEADIKALAAYYAAQPGLETSRKRVSRLSAR